jgi:hypothetical protein
MRLLNCTYNTLRFVDRNLKVIKVLYPCGILPVLTRRGPKYEKVESVYEIPIRELAQDIWKNLPAPKPDTYFIVDYDVAEFARRSDLLTPYGCTQITTCKGVVYRCLLRLHPFHLVALTHSPT